MNDSEIRPRELGHGWRRHVRELPEDLGAIDVSGGEEAWRWPCEERLSDLEQRFERLSEAARYAPRGQEIFEEMAVLSRALELGFPFGEVHQLWWRRERLVIRAIEVDRTGFPDGDSMVESSELSNEISLFEHEIVEFARHGAILRPEEMLAFSLCEACECFNSPLPAGRTDGGGHDPGEHQRVGRTSRIAGAVVADGTLSPNAAHPHRRLSTDDRKTAALGSLGRLLLRLASTPGEHGANRIDGQESSEHHTANERTDT